jgi:hypothetical protein
MSQPTACEKPCPWQNWVAPGQPQPSAQTAHQSTIAPPACGKGKPLPGKYWTVSIVEPDVSGAAIDAAEAALAIPKTALIKIGRKPTFIPPSLNFQELAKSLNRA